MPFEYFGSNLVFKRFKQVKSATSLKLFKFALKNLPMIDGDQEMSTLIDEENEKMYANNAID